VRCSISCAIAAKPESTDRRLIINTIFVSSKVVISLVTITIESITFTVCQVPSKLKFNINPHSGEWNHGIVSYENQTVSVPLSKSIINPDLTGSAVHGQINRLILFHRHKAGCLPCPVPELKGCRQAEWLKVPLTRECKISPKVHWLPGILPAGSSPEARPQNGGPLI
jgi:hypothetical protein